jgi:RNA polymerase sigma factor (sigma-70 family)
VSTQRVGDIGMDGRQWRSTIAAAQAGDRRALDDLVAGWLPLVYNVVGRALNGHADVDDVVQETMLRAVDNLGSLRDPDSFRSWLMAIAMRQIRDRARRRSPQQLDESAAREATDFAELTVLRLQLEGQRREVAEAVRWLDDEDRQLLSLWWLEVSGRLTRRELADALELTPQHAAVRVQRVKAQLESARSVVRAITAVPRCYELATLTLEWDGRPCPLWRKRLARHTRDCPACGGVAADQVPAERLLVGLALVPLPLGFGLKVLSGLAATAAAATGATAAGTGATASATGATASATGTTASATVSATAAGHGGLGALVRAGFQVAMKPVVASVAGVTLVAGGAAVVYQVSRDSAGRPLPRAAATATATATATSAALGASPLPSLVPATSPPATSPPAPTSASPTPLSGYGSVVDVADPAPDPNLKPGVLPKRAVTTLTSTGGAKAVLSHNTDTVTLKGKGYFRVRWQIGTTTGRIGVLDPASWTGLRGQLFHVASGGGRRNGRPVRHGLRVHRLRHASPRRPADVAERVLLPRRRGHRPQQREPRRLQPHRRAQDLGRHQHRHPLGAPGGRDPLRRRPGHRR